MANQLHTGRRTKRQQISSDAHPIKTCYNKQSNTLQLPGDKKYNYDAPEWILLWCAGRCKAQGDPGIKCAAMGAPELRGSQAVRPRYKERRYGCAGVEGEHQQVLGGTVSNAMGSNGVRYNHGEY